MIVEREHEIEKFKPREYWTIEADLEKDKQAFTARLTHLHGKKLSQFSINKDKQAHATEQEIVDASKGKLTVTKIRKEAAQT